MSRCRPIVPILVLAALVGACAASSSQSGERVSNNVITQEEIQQARGGSAYDVVRQLRSRWLMSTSRGEVWAYYDNRRIGEVEALRGIAASDVGSIEYFSFAEAIGRYPDFSSGAGVIQVNSKRN
jgi:hypothetical protein